MLAGTYKNLGGFAEADDLLSECLKTAGALGPEHEYTPLYRCLLGSLRCDQGRLEEAEEILIEALYGRPYESDHLLGPSNPHRMHFQTILASVYLRRGCHDEAEEQALKVYQEASQSLGQAHRETLFAMQKLAKVYAAQERFDAAEALLQDALARSRVQEQPGPAYAQPSLALAKFYANHGPYQQVQELLTSYVQDQQRLLGEDHPALVMRLNEVAWLLATHPSPEVRNGTKAVTYARKVCDLSHWKNGMWIDTLAAAYAENSDFPEAVRCQKQAIELLEDTLAEEALSGCKDRLSLYLSRKPYRENE
jgi:tetratricopeptide (TPR) repeat protein